MGFGVEESREYFRDSHWEYSQWDFPGRVIRGWAQDPRVRALLACPFSRARAAGAGVEITDGGSQVRVGHIHGQLTSPQINSDKTYKLYVTCVARRVPQVRPAAAHRRPLRRSGVRQRP
jgi:hypothetical protein